MNLVNVPLWFSSPVVILVPQREAVQLLLQCLEPNQEPRPAAPCAQLDQSASSTWRPGLEGLFPTSSRLLWEYLQLVSYFKTIIPSVEVCLVSKKVIGCENDDHRL